MPPGTLRRSTGLNSLNTASIRSRLGSSLLTSFTGEANSLVEFANAIYIGTTAGAFLRFDELTNVLSELRYDLSGEPLSFFIAPPSTSLPDYLYVSGGGKHFKVDALGNVSGWGMDAPPNGFTAQGWNPKRHLLSLWSSGDTGWDASGSSATGVTLATSTLTASGMMVTIDADKVAVLVKETAIDLSKFGLALSAEYLLTSHPNDYLTFRCWVDGVESLDYLQLQLDLGQGGDAGTFQSDFYTYRFINGVEGQASFDEAATRLSKAITDGLKKGNRIIAVDNEGVPLAEQTNALRRVSSLYQSAYRSSPLPSANKQWFDLRIKIADLLTARSGEDTSVGLPDITAIRFLLKCARTATTPIVVHFSDARLQGGYGTRGAVEYKVTWWDSKARVRSNPNTISVPTDLSLERIPDRFPYKLSGLPYTDAPEQADYLEIWRTLGSEGAVFFLSQRIALTELATTRTVISDTLNPGEIIDYTADASFLNSRQDQFQAGAGQIQTTGTTVNGTFLDAGDEGIPIGAILKVGDDTRTIVNKLSASDFVLDYPIDWSTPTDFSWTQFEAQLGDLDPTELPLDNTPPLDTFTDTVYFGGRAWWLDAAQPGRLNFGPQGRVESLSDFRETISNTEKLTRILVWNGALWAFSTERIYQVTGDTFIMQEVFGSPGCSNGRTAVASPVGIIYQATDGVRVFDGARSQGAYEALAPLFQGQEVEGIPAFEGTVATAGPREYFISDGTTCLAFDLTSGRWRSLGLTLSCLLYSQLTSRLLATPTASLLSVEVEGTTLDDETAIPFEVQTPTQRVDEGQLGTLQRIYLDLDTGNQPLTLQTITDQGTTQVGTIRADGRTRVELALLLALRQLAVRLTSEDGLTAPIEIFGIEADVHVPSA